MNKIINGKKYDTATAEEIWFCDNGESGFNHVKETLYRKHTGEYFLHGQGGAATGYAAYCDGGGTCWGEMIVPLSEQDVFEYAFINMTADEYKKVFGEVEE